jgi:hypothetical protein
VAEGQDEEKAVENTSSDEFAFFENGADSGLSRANVYMITEIVG